jgi:hypothetical protein
MRLPLRSAAFQIAARAVLVVVALVLLSRAQAGLVHFREIYARNLRFDVAPWLSWLVPAALSGAALALAAAPNWTFRYRWAVSLTVGLVPMLLLAQTLYVFGVAAPNNSSSSWLTRPYWFSVAAEPQFVLAVLVGVALGLGFAGTRSPKSS